MFLITTAVTGVVFGLTQILLFWFSYKYQESYNRKAFYYPHNNKLELLWTTVPAIFLTVLVVFGLKYWFKITADAPKDAIVVEVTGHQFAWEFRYPGADKMLGKKDYKLTTSKNNLGVDFNDPASKDDIHVNTTAYPGRGTGENGDPFTGCYSRRGSSTFPVENGRCSRCSNHAVVYTQIHYGRNEKENKQPEFCL